MNLPEELETEAHALTARVGDKGDVSDITSLMLDAAEEIRKLQALVKEWAKAWNETMDSRDELVEALRRGPSPHQSHCLTWHVEDENCDCGLDALLAKIDAEGE